jgi:hypothetical protein
MSFALGLICGLVIGACITALAYQWLNKYTEPDAGPLWLGRSCPPCDGQCEQGRRCPAGDKI